MAIMFHARDMSIDLTIASVRQANSFNDKVIVSSKVLKLFNFTLVADIRY